MQTLNIEPRPLIFSRRKLVVAWSPKSACSHVALWFFHKEGLFQALVYYHEWPHNFRAQVYYHAQTYLKQAQALRDSGGTGYTLLRITRDPTRRMVSIFRHVCRHSFLREALDAHFRRPTAATGVSMVELHDYLRGRPLMVPSEVNFHLCAQYHPVWEMEFDRVITLNIDSHALNEGLNAVEEEFDLPVTRFERIKRFDKLRRDHYAREIDYEGTEPIERVRFTPAMTREFPKKALEASAYARAMAEELHGVDLPHVSTGDTARRIVFPLKGAAVTPT